MAFSLALRTVGDYFIHDDNVVPGNPIAAWTGGATPPTEGQLVIRDNTVDNGFDVCADGEVPIGIVVTTNGTTGTIGVAEFQPGSTIVLPFDTAPSLGDDIAVSAGGLKDVGTAGFQRSQVKTGAGTGSMVVIDLAPFGVTGVGTETTATVRF